jgi:hypothetical protein
MISRTRSESADEARTPVGPEGHPLRTVLPSSPGETALEDSSSDDARSSPRRPRPPTESVNLNERFVETVQEEEEDESEDNRDSDFDAELGGDDDTSSNWDSTDYGQPPTISSLVLLSSLYCRVPTQVTAKDGSKVSCVCGKTTDLCKRHADKIAKGAYRGNEGYYVSMNDPARGFQGHGKLAFFYTSEQYQELRRKENAEMRTLLAAQEDNFSDGDEEALDLAREARVSFGSSVEILEPPVISPTAAVEAARKNLEARTGGRTKQRKAVTPPDSTKSTNESRFYGLEDNTQRRWIFHDFSKVRECLEDYGFHLKEVFNTSLEATQWKNRHEEVKDDTDRFNAMFGKPSSTHASTKKAKATSRPPRPGNGDPSSSSSGQASSNSDSSVSSLDKRRKKKHPKDRKKGKPVRPSRRPAGSSGPSSSDDSSSEESSSDSSHSYSRSRKKQAPKSSKKSARAKRKKRHSRQSKTSGADASIGNKKHIHEMAITGRKIDKAMGPEDFRTKDTTELYNAAADIAAIPGMLGVNRSLDEDARNTTEMAATLIATAVGNGRRSIHDSMWQGARRNALDQIKDREGLFSFVKAVDKDKEAAFEKQDQAIQTLLFHRHYSETSIDEYLRNGLLPRITRESFRCYSNLLSTIRQLAFDHGTLWEGGPAKAMLDYHSFKLLQARRHALSRKMLVLRTYAYLRDAESKSFYNESMTEGLWDRLAVLTEKVHDAPVHESPGTANPDPKKDPAGNGQLKKKVSEGTPKCSHCRSAAVHKALKIDPARTLCPFLELSQADARKAAVTACAAHKESGGAFKDCCQAALESFQ